MDAAVVATTGSFVELGDLGKFRVPPDYDHKMELEKLHRVVKDPLFGGQVTYLNKEAVRDQHFSNPSHILRPGEEFVVRAFVQSSLIPTTTAEDRIRFLLSEDGVLLGAQGLSFCWRQNPNRFSQLGHRRGVYRGRFWFTSMDTPDRLWQNPDGYHGMLQVCVVPDGTVEFFLAHWEAPCLVDQAFICFNRV